MELRFMGQTYTTANNTVATTLSKQTAKFKGQKYQVRVPVQTVNVGNAYMKKYRGVAYSL